jgi:hypothetical protein
MKRTRLLLPLSLLATFALAGSASAATEIGQVRPDGSLSLTCNANTGLVQGNHSAGVRYDSPVDGVITQWSTRADAGGGQAAMQVLSRSTTINTEFTPLAESAVATLTPNVLNEIDTRVPIVADQYIGLRMVTATGCAFQAEAGNTTFGAPPPAPAVGGGPRDYGNGQGNQRMNLAVTIEADKDGDGYGDETQDGCPNKSQRQDDCVAPSVEIVKGPKKKTKNKKAKFKFSSDDAKASFECSLDGKKFKPCASPFKTKKLKPGKHRFEVRAVDENDNTSSVAAYKWKVKKKK